MPVGCLELPQRLVRQLRSSAIARRLRRKAFSCGRRTPPSSAASGDAARDLPSASPCASARVPTAGRPTRRQRALLDAVLKNLDAAQLQALDEAVRSGGAVRTGCVLVDCAGDSGPSAGDDQCRLCCRAWRWPELPERAELRPLPLCAPPPDKSCRCVNPYHWSRVLRGAVGLPVSGQFTQCIDGLALSDCASAYAGLLNSTTSSTSEQHDSWCQVAYWELSQRIGPLFRVTSNTIDVFHDNPLHGCGGLSLQALWDAANHERQDAAVDLDDPQLRSHQQQPQHPDETVTSSSDRRNQLRTRIGLGLSLQRDSLGGVWVYNRSELAVFIGSRFLDRTIADATKSFKGSKDGSSVLKVPPGYCAQVYDFGEQHSNAQFSRRLADDIYVGPSDPQSVHLSFGKGWGPGYTRQSITGCSCWLEILLND